MYNNPGHILRCASLICATSTVLAFLRGERSGTLKMCGGIPVTIPFNKYAPRSEHELEEGNLLSLWSFSLTARTSHETLGRL